MVFKVTCNELSAMIKPYAVCLWNELNVAILQEWWKRDCSSTWQRECISAAKREKSCPGCLDRNRLLMVNLASNAPVWFLSELRRPFHLPGVWSVLQLACVTTPLFSGVYVAFITAPKQHEICRWLAVFHFV